MSTFPGLIEEIPGISIDNFTGENMGSQLFFLSHCHSDHMYGIRPLFTSPEFKREGVFLYGSPTTVVILKNMFCDLPKNVKELPVGKEVFLKIRNRDICVTLVPAGHCPGSVMFLFEEEKTILYTGDIRVTVKEIKEMKCFKNMCRSVKKIDKMYFDSTFFKKEYLNFPPREKSIDQFINCVEFGLQDKNNTILYEMRAKFGSEFVMKKTYEKIKIPFRVTPDAYRIYKFIPEMDKVVTLDPSKTRIFAATPSKIRKLFANCKAYHIITTAMRWNNEDFSEGICEQQNGANLICYSSHCSLQELLDICHYLKPLDLYPCVVPKDLKEKKEMDVLIQKTLDDIQKNRSSECSNGIRENDIGPKRSWVFSGSVGEKKSLSMPGNSGDSDNGKETS